MTNHIQHFDIHDLSLAPTQAELAITVLTEHRTPTTEVRGRLMGPRCPFANTVEIAYPLRPLPPARHQAFSPASKADFTLHVVIPEASLWDPGSPFLYEGPLELWQDGTCVDRLHMVHGLRQLLLTRDRLLVNGQRLTLQGQALSGCTADQALQLRDAGINLLLVPVTAHTEEVWELADRLGFLVLGQLRDVDSDTLSTLPKWHRHPSCLGWVVNRAEDIEAVSRVRNLQKTPPCGLMLDALPSQPVPAGVSFVILPATARAQVKNLGLPVLLCDDSPEGPHAETGEAVEPGVLGWVKGMGK